jgi:HAD superfamily phosphatase (TIGR01668 family)
MSRRKILQPDLVLGDVIIHLTPSLIQHYQLKGLVLDVDETLVPWKENEVSPDLLKWVNKIKSVADLWLVSNNISERRIKAIASALDLPYFYGAAKPSRRKLRQAIEAMNLQVEKVAMVGDRLFTDVLAGNRLGMFTILVEPMVKSGEIPRSWSIRNIEVWISQKLGISLQKTQHNFTNNDQKPKT